MHRPATGSPKVVPIRAPWLLGLALVACCVQPTPTASAGAAGQITATASPAEVSLGSPVSVSGNVGAGALPLTLEADPYPYRGYTALASGSSGADGSFTFPGIQVDRDTRLRVAVAGSGAQRSAPIAVTVEPTVAINAAGLAPGRVRLSVRLRHTVNAGASPPINVTWFLAPRGHARPWRLAAVTPSRELSPGLTYASATVDPPAARFAYRVCLTPSWELAMGRPPRAGVCGGLVYHGEGRGRPLAPYPSAGSISAAARYLAARAGRTSLAVVDSDGTLSGLHTREHFETASVVKVMMLVAYLQMRSAEHRGLDGSDRSLLYPMIHISDNDAASAVLAVVGAPAVARVAREAGMRDYAPGVGWWAFTQTSAADQARLFYELPKLIPPQFYPYARGLLAGIEPSQSWGIPPVARPRWQVFFKTGALPSRGLFNEVARLERPGLAFTIAVFTDGDPSMSYAEQTIAGVAQILLAHSP
jgi:hypothetical protein